MKPVVFGEIMDFFAEGKPVMLAEPVVTDTTILDDDDEVVAMIKELLQERVRQQAGLLSGREQKQSRAYVWYLSTCLEACRCTFVSGVYFVCAEACFFSRQRFSWGTRVGGEAGVREKRIASEFFDAAARILFVRNGQCWRLTGVGDLSTQWLVGLVAPSRKTRSQSCRGQSKAAVWPAAFFTLGQGQSAEDDISVVARDKDILVHERGN